MASEATSINLSGGFARIAHPSRSLDSAIMRGIDVTVALMALLFLFPLLVFVTIAVMIASPGPIFFKQERIGRYGRTFYCIKFRTMVIDAQERLEQYIASNAEARLEWQLTHKLKKDPRITAIGTFLRRSSLDELPQLINVLRGEMGLVGPRPIVMAEAPRYGRYIVNYCSVRPGVTGLWQISGRNNVSYRRRVALDTTYTRTKSLSLDMKILIKTIPAVLAARGSY